jgi:hypothetical protein
MELLQRAFASPVVAGLTLVVLALLGAVILLLRRRAPPAHKPRSPFERSYLPPDMPLVSPRGPRPTPSPGGSQLLDPSIPMTPRRTQAAFLRPNSARGSPELPMTPRRMALATAGASGQGQPMTPRRTQAAFLGILGRDLRGLIPCR